MQAYRDLRITTVVVVTLIVFEAINQPIILLLGMFAPDFFAANITPVATTVDGASLGVLLFTMVAFSYWIYCAGRNVTDVGVDGLKFTPGSRIWWFAVPFANLVMPFRGMRELWNASRGELDLETNHWLVTSWWTFWLINNVIANLSNFLMRDAQSGTMPIWLTVAAGIPLAVTAIMLLRSIDSAQRDTGPQELNEVFA